MIGDKLNKPFQSKKVSKSEKTKLKKYYKQIREIFNVNDYKTAYNNLKELLYNLYDMLDVLKRLIKQVLVPNFKRLTTFLHNPKISPTNNPVENYYPQTLPRAKKNIQNNPRTKQLSNTQKTKLDTKTQKTPLTPNNFTAPLLLRGQSGICFWLRGMVVLRVLFCVLLCFADVANPNIEKYTHACVECMESSLWYDDIRAEFVCTNCGLVHAGIDLTAAYPFGFLLKKP
jgi:hypothetical protein